MMIEEEAIVVSSNGQYAWVSPLENSSCSGCESSGACSTSFLKGILKRKSERTIRIVNLEAVEPGEHASISDRRRDFLWRILRWLSSGGA